MNNTEAIAVSNAYFSQSSHHIQIGSIRWQRIPVGYIGTGNTFVGHIGLSSSQRKEDLRNEQKIAVKRITKMGETTVNAQLIRQLIHRSHENSQSTNVAKYYAIEEDCDFWYIATELFEDTLESFVKKSYQKSSKSNILKYTNSMLNVCHQAAQGLEYIHENGLIHGEIKPRNILVRKRKEGTGIACKIADLGLSNTSYTNGHNNLSSKLDFEKLSWMAPELLQHGSWNNRSQKCDVWSFGCIVHYALTGGEHPFGDGLHQRAINIAQGICQLGSLRRCKDLQHAITADVVTLVEKMICLNPNSRPTISQVVPLLKPNSLKNSSRKTAMPQNKYPDALFKTEISYSSVKLQAVKVKDAIIFLLSSLMVLILENLNLKRVVETTVKTDENEDGITEQVNGQSDNQHHKADDTRRWTKEDLKRGR